MNFDLSKLNDPIYSTFEVGKSYTKPVIKSTLAKIYKEVGYKVTAKATDLSNYFEIRRASVFDGVKRVGGFKLLSKLDNSSDPTT